MVHNIPHSNHDVCVPTKNLRQSPFPPHQLNPRPPIIQTRGCIYVGINNAPRACMPAGLPRTNGSGWERQPQKKALSPQGSDAYCSAPPTESVKNTKPFSQLDVCSVTCHMQLLLDHQKQQIGTNQQPAARIPRAQMI